MWKAWRGKLAIVLFSQNYLVRAHSWFCVVMCNRKCWGRIIQGSRCPLDSWQRACSEMLIFIHIQKGPSCLSVAVTIQHLNGLLHITLYNILVFFVVAVMKYDQKQLLEKVFWLTVAGNRVMGRSAVAGFLEEGHASCSFPNCSTNWGPSFKHMSLSWAFLI